RGAPKMRRRTGIFTNGILPKTTGAGSFRRWLGCAPTIVARVSHGSAAWEPARRFLNNHRTDVGRSQPCSDLTTGAAPRVPRDLHLLDGRKVRNSPVGFHAESGTDHLGLFWKTACAVCLNAQPNGMRLSCGADCKISQIEDYHSRTAPPASGAC